MSNFKSIWPTITLGDKNYSLVCNLNVIEAIQDRYGEFDKLAEVLAEKSIREYKWLLMTFINEGIYTRKQNGENISELTERDIGALIDITKINQDEITKFIRASVMASLPQVNPLKRLKEVVAKSISRGISSSESHC